MDTCAICWDDVYPANYVISCNHNYHYDCIKKWFERSNRCPVCRQGVIDKFLCYRQYLRSKTSLFISLTDKYIYIKEFKIPLKTISYNSIKNYSINKNKLGV